MIGQQNAEYGGLYLGTITDAVGSMFALDGKGCTIIIQREFKETCKGGGHKANSDVFSATILACIITMNHGLPADSRKALQTL